MPRIVVDMNDQRPKWARPDWFEEELRAACPQGWSLAVLDTPSEGTGDGSTRAHPRVLEAVADAQVYMGFGIAEEVIEAGPGIRWVHSGSAGVGSSITPAMRERDPVFTNTAGIHGPPMAEVVLGMLLHFFRGFDFAVAAQRRGAWDTAPFYAADSPVRELRGATIGIVGFGGIGREVADRVTPLGANVIGLRRRAMAAGAASDSGSDSASVSASVSGSAPPVGDERRAAWGTTEVVRGDGGLDRLLSESDAVVLTAPDTPETRGMIDAGAFARMKPGAILVNVARGALLDEGALIAALESGRLRGAGLDVFDPEPLASDSPLWSFENVLITPHVSGVTDLFWRREADLILHNLRCWIAGEPDRMRNVVDLEAGY